MWLARSKAKHFIFLARIYCSNSNGSSRKNDVSGNILAQSQMGGDFRNQIHLNFKPQNTGTHADRKAYMSPDTGMVTFAVVPFATGHR